MNVYYASQSFYPHIGGVSTYLLTLCKRMVKHGNSVVEVHLRPSGETDSDDFQGIEIHRVPREPLDSDLLRSYSTFKEAVYTECHYNEDRFTKPADEMPGFHDFSKVNEYFGEQLKLLLEENPADIVHIHDFQLLFTYKYVPRGTPLILTWHIPFIQGMSEPLATFLIRHMNEYDRVVFSSQEYIDAAVAAGLEKEKACLIHPITNTDIFRKLDIDPAAVRKKHSIPDGKIILCVQRIDPKSGHEQLIRAMPRVLEDVPDAHLVFVGGHSMSNRLSKDRERLAQEVKRLVTSLQLQDRVHFLGNIDYHEMPAVYNAADAVALCSRNEGFGLSLTEAMACGRPVIGTRTGGIGIQIEHGGNGYLVDVGDVPATAESLATILRDEGLRERMAARSLEIVEDRFKTEHGIEQHLMLYTDAIRQKDEFHRIEYHETSDFKGIITDLDRTLTDGPARAEFFEEDFDESVFAELQRSGLDLFLATGRNIRFVRALCDRFDVWRAVIAENGSVIYFPRTGKTITVETWHMERAREIVQGLGLPGTVVGKVITSNRLSDEERIRDALGDLAKELNFVRNVDEIMILPGGVDKGVGIRIVMQYLNLDLGKMIVIGDGENDVDMFHNPGFKIALANAHEKVKRLANQVTEQPATAGIREFIRKLSS